MAFNPFTSFRKYQKFWMATILLLCMVTFVLCTGVGGDLSERLLQIFRPGGGSVVAKLDGRKVYRHELDDLKERRNIANEFMKGALEQYILRIEKAESEVVKKIKESERGPVLTQLRGLKEDLAVRKLKPRYFDSGVKFDELIDFMVWRAQADRLRVNLAPDDVGEMVARELFAGALEQFDIPFERVRYEVMIDVRRNHQNTTDTVIHDALRDEFRVRIAQLARLSAQPTSYSKRGQGLERIKINFGMPPYDDPVMRVVPSPAQLWDVFRKQREVFDVALIPVKVEDFLDSKDLPKPAEADLEAFFQAHKDRLYDPTSPDEGLGIPHSIRVGWITGDPQSAHYQKAAKTVRLLEKHPPLAYHPAQAPLLTLATHLARESAWQASMADYYDQRKADPRKGFEYLSMPLTEPDYAWHLIQKVESEKPTPAAVAAFVGAATRPDATIAAPLAFRWHAYVAHKDKLGPALADELKSRAPVYATVVLSGAAGSPFDPLAYWHRLRSGYLLTFVPLSLVQKEFEELAVNQLAEGWVQSNMVAVRNVLEGPRNVGQPFNFMNAAQNEAAKHQLRLGTSQYHDRFTIAHAPELEHLRDGFRKYYERINMMEGRQRTEKELKEDDFVKLFFDAGEPFSLASKTKPFDPQTWPPKIHIKGALTPARDPKATHTIDLFEGSLPLQVEAMLAKGRPGGLERKPIIFWKSDDKLAELPKDLAAVRARVERAWKVQKARGDKDNFAMGKAWKIAENLQKGAADYLRVITDAAKELKRDPIYLRDVARMSPKKQDFEMVREYEEFPLPRDKFLYPRDDMAKQILSLVDLKKPIESGNATLDDLNQKLFEGNKQLEKEGLGKLVQILTNKPQTDFYVAVVVTSPFASRIEFDHAYKRAVGQPGDRFVDRSHHYLAKEYRQRLVQQLRDDMRFEIISPSDAKSYDTDAAQQER